MSVRMILVHADFPPLAEMDYGGTFAHGVAALAAALRANGHTMELLHLTGPPSRDRLVGRIRESGADLIGFSAITPTFPEVRRWLEWIRPVASVPIVVGGTHAILRPADVLDAPGVDLACTGEADETLVELCARIDAGRSLHGVAGTWSRDAAEIRRNPQRPLVPDLDRLPLPDYSIFDSTRMFGAETGRMAVMVSRGCPYHCSYCANDSIRDSYSNPWDYPRHFSPARAVAVVERLLSDHPRTRELVFNDNILYPSRPWLEEFAGLYRTRVGLPFTANTRPNLVDAGTVELLRGAGCRRIAMGIESGDETIANQVLRRGIRNDQIRRAFRLFRAAGIETSAYNILGSPFETRTSMLRTIRLNAEIDPDILASFLFYPFPGTYSEQICRREGFLTGRWGRNNSDLVMITQPTVSDVDVLFAQRYFGRLVRLYRSVEGLPAGIRRPAGRALDSVLASPFVPRRALLALRDLKRRCAPVTSRAARPATPSRCATPR